MVLDPRLGPCLLFTFPPRPTPRPTYLVRQPGLSKVHRVTLALPPVHKALWEETHELRGASCHRPTEWSLTVSPQALALAPALTRDLELPSPGPAQCGSYAVTARDPVSSVPRWYPFSIACSMPGGPCIPPSSPRPSSWGPLLHLPREVLCSYELSLPWNTITASFFFFFPFKGISVAGTNEKPEVYHFTSGSTYFSVMITKFCS